MKATILFFVFIVFCLNSFAQETKPSAPSIYLSYDYYHYDLKGSSIATTNIYTFGTTTIDYHLLSATWLFSPTWTLIAFVPYSKTMVETIYEPTATGLNFATKDYVGGFNDIRLMAVTPLSLNPNYLTMFDIGFTLPTGSTDEYFTSSPKQRAAYNMQLGSGTPDLYIGTTVTNTMNDLISTARAQVAIRGGKNAIGYALGNEFLAKLASTYNLNPYLGVGVSANYKMRGAIQGRDAKYELFNNYQNGLISGDGHQYYHGTQANWDAAAVVKLHTPTFYSVVASFEVGVPFWQGAANKDDIRIDTRYYLAGNLSTAF
ncbi:MAG: hypothetical protein H7328_04985 [Bdellovibrio sp.]|nr:hypothetical protein [Bdellovibrio sp.]